MSDQNSEVQGQPVTEGQQTQTPPGQPAEVGQPAPVTPSPAPVGVAPRLVDSVAPRYLTQDELVAALEKQQRQTQSLVDKASYNLRRELYGELATTDGILQDPEIQAYFGDDAPEVMARQRSKKIAQYFGKEPTPPVESEQPPALTPEQQAQQIQQQSIMDTTSRLTGINPGDQDYVDPGRANNADEWIALMQEAYRRRSNPPKVPQQPQQQPNVPQPVTPPVAAPSPVATSAPVTLGTGGVPREATPLELSRAHGIAVRSGNREEAARLEKALKALQG